MNEKDLYSPVWGDPQIPLQINESQVDVWRASQNLPEFALKRLRLFLSKDELEVADSYEFKDEGNHFIASRGTLRKILGLYLKVNPAEIRFTYGAHGKPRLEYPESPLEFNISHSGDIVVVAVTKETQVGVDIEYLNMVSDIDFMSDRFLTRREKEAYSELDDDDKRKEFLACWTLKEACVKATGLSIRGLLPSLDVCFNPHMISLPREEGDEVTRNPCHAMTFTPAAKYVASIVVDIPKAYIRFYNY
jgi:4'-phosphopantetheinyl transferase